MARILMSIHGRMVGGPTRGGPNTKLRIYDDEALTTPSTYYRQSSGGGTQPFPLIPNAGVPATTIANRITTDTFVTCADVSTFNVGDLVPISDGVNTAWRVITAITGSPTNRLDLDAALGFNFNTGTKVNRNSMRGHVHAWLDNVRSYYIEWEDVGSGERMPKQHLPIAAAVNPINVQDEGTLVNNRGTINIIGPGIAATDDVPNTRVNITLDPNGLILAGTHAGRPAAGVNGRLYIYTDASIGAARDNGASWLDFTLSPMTTAEDLIKGGASGVPARLAVGATDAVLSVIAGVIGWRYPLLTTAEALLSSDVAMTNANQYYDGPSVSLVAGTWIITAGVMVTRTGASLIEAKLWDGTTVESSVEHTSQATGGVDSTALHLSGIVVLASTTTMKVSCAAVAATTTLKAAMQSNGAGNNASYIRAVRVA